MGKLHHNVPCFLSCCVSCFVSNPAKSLRKHKTTFATYSLCFREQCICLTVTFCVYNPRNIFKNHCGFDWWDFRNMLWCFLNRCVQLLTLILTLTNIQTEPQPGSRPLKHCTHFKVIQRSGIPLKTGCQTQTTKPIRTFASGTNIGSLLQ